MQKEITPRGIAALPILTIVLVLAIVVVGAVYFATRDQDNTNTVVTTNTTNSIGLNLNTVLENRNTSPVTNLNAATNTNSSPNANVAGNANTNAMPDGWQEYINFTYDFSLALPPEWGGYSVTTYDHKYPVTNEDSDFSSVVFEHPDHTGSSGRPGKVAMTIYVAEGTAPSFPLGVMFLGDDNGRRYGYSKSNAATPDELATYWSQIDSIAGTFVAR